MSMDGVLWPEKMHCAGCLLRQLASGTSELICHDTEGRCILKEAWKETSGFRLWRRCYRYSPAGNLLQVENDHSTVTYSYDIDHRLARETLANGSVRHFRYDCAGNLLSQPGLSQVTVGHTNQLLTANADHFETNVRGHITRRRGPSGER